MTFGEKSKYIRDKLFLSQVAFAKELGLSYATINRWETGKYEPSIKAKKVLHEFCKKNGIRFEEKI